MLMSGFTIIRNGLQFDFPFLESIQSLLPICDEFIVNIGASDDKTYESLLTFQKKIKIIETTWPFQDPKKRQGGKILADQTNRALQECKGAWCFYLQADEVLHEQDLHQIQTELLNWEKDLSIEAVVFNYRHFYGSYHVIQTSRASYRREIRVIRNGLGIQSVGDAQSFRHQDGRKLKAVLSGARVFHYGWVRPQEIMRKKTAFMDSLYHPHSLGYTPETGQNYRYKKIVGLKPYRGSHPQVMLTRVKQAKNFDFSQAPWIFHLNDIWKVISGWIEKATGFRPFEYRNYKLIKRPIASWIQNH